VENLPEAPTLATVRLGVCARVEGREVCVSGTLLLVLLLLYIRRIPLSPGVTYPQRTRSITIVLPFLSFSSLHRTLTLSQYCRHRPPALLKPSFSGVFKSGWCGAGAGGAGPSVLVVVDLSEPDRCKAGRGARRGSGEWGGISLTGIRLRRSLRAALWRPRARIKGSLAGRDAGSRVEVRSCSISGRSPRPLPLETRADSDVAAEG
jgi:hypothetical protein